MNNMIGKMLDNRYELLEVIGSGGMAVVYKAKCHRLNRLVAVKVLKSDLAEDADFRRRFRDVPDLKMALSGRSNKRLYLLIITFLALMTIILGYLTIKHPAL